ncbi:hypothetical protein [Paenibacillus sp. sgz500958]|uniref:hypothetical protein n=1 Tax=Paenibacillus sp. sgz500958 TaxID=3242475 RepID=UPI0036D3B2A2
MDKPEGGSSSFINRTEDYEVGELVMLLHPRDARIQMDFLKVLSITGSSAVQVGNNDYIRLQSNIQEVNHINQSGDDSTNS